MLLAGACSSSVRAPVHNGGLPAAPGGSPPSAPAVAPNPGSHTVAKGDTLYSIAWRYGQDYRDLARWNGINAPYIIKPGQVLTLRAPLRTPERIRQRVPSVATPVPPVSRQSAARDNPDRIRWRWPTSGSLVASDTPTSRNGIDIAGQRGQSIVASAPGSVVYSGSGLLGYGRLIIVKHSDSYLSAYAHNEKLLVKEGDRVTSGQQIATMGLGSDGKPVLHFEIRKDGKPINPLDQLPRQPS